MIRATSLSKHFGSLRAVDGVDLEIAPGEFFAFLGPNAAGKTTTIKMLCGLLRPTAGRVEICGFDIQAEPEKAQFEFNALSATGTALLVAGILAGFVLRVSPLQGMSSRPGIP